MSENVQSAEELQKQNERLKRKLTRARTRLESSRRRVDELEAANSEIREELDALKAVVEVYDKHRPQAAEKKNKGGLDESSSDEDFEDELPSFDKTSARDDTHLSRISAPKNGTDQFGADLVRSSAAATTGERKTSGPLLTDDARSASRHQRTSSDGAPIPGTQPQLTSHHRVDIMDINPPTRSTSGGAPSTKSNASTRRQDVPKATGSGSVQRKFNTTRDIGISLSKEDEQELFGGAKKQVGSPPVPSRATRTGTETPAQRATIATHTPSASTPVAVSSPPPQTQPRRSKSAKDDLPTTVEPDSTATARDQPRIFDENTVRDILCGLSITMSRTFNDDLLVPGDYSYSYQFKVRRVPQQLLKFKDFAPKVFQQIRSHWGVDNSELLLSFGYDNLDAIRGEGKSGAFFIFTRDKRYILKTATGPERDFLWEMLPYYFLYVRKNPNTLLPRFYGVYSMKHEGIGGMVRFVVMNNWFATPSPLGEVYDLKGSTLGRSSAEDGGSVLKDLDIKRKLYMADESIKKLFLDQLYMDSQFLAQHNVMDYSLLVGIHYDNEEGRAAKAKKQAEWNKLYTEDPSFRSILQLDGGGIAGWNPETKCREVYFIGIIDILQRYTSKKRIEHLLKSIPYKAATVSVVEPGYYAKRFHSFLSGVTATSPIVVSQAPAKLSTLSEDDDDETEEDVSETEPSSSMSAVTSPLPVSLSEHKARTGLSTGDIHEALATAASTKKRSKKSSSFTSQESGSRPATASPPLAAPNSDGVQSPDVNKDATAVKPRRKKKKRAPKPSEELSESSDEDVPPVEPRKKKRRAGPKASKSSESLPNAN